MSAVAAQWILGTGAAGRRLLAGRRLTDAEAAAALALHARARARAGEVARIAEWTDAEAIAARFRALLADERAARPANPYDALVSRLAAEACAAARARTLDLT